MLGVDPEKFAVILHLSSFRPPPRWYLVVTLYLPGYDDVSEATSTRLLMCRYRGTDRLLLSIEIACSCVSTIGKESSGEKQHDDDVCAGVVVAFVAAGARGRDVRTRRREQGGRESKEEVKIFWRSRKLSHSHPLFTFVYTPST